MGRVHAVGVEELGHLPFVRHQVDPSLVTGSWASGAAAVVAGGRRMADPAHTVVTGFGPAAELAPLLNRVAEQVAVPDRVMVTAPAGALPTSWAPGETRSWHWMLTTELPALPAVDVVEVTGPEPVNRLLDIAQPDTMARPGSPGIEAWLGIEDHGRLVAVGGVVRQPDGTGHLRAVSVHPEQRGRGLGRQLSLALTRRAMADTGIASLGAYVDNEPALGLYRSLGFRVVHTFTSGTISRPGRT